ncbi:MAG: c-type cytochrome [Phormidesmis sp.]|mgnify:CR=1 FL=1
MKAFIAAVLAVFIGVLAPFGGSAIAADLAAGAQVFASNCAACHIGGNNAVMAQKTLKVDALEQYLDGYGAEHDINAIVKQVTYGKNAMAAFGSRLSEDEIANVAAYVQDQSDKGW